MTTYGPFGFATATTDGSDDFLYTNTQGGPSQNGDTLPATTGNLQLWWNDDDTGSTGVGPESGQEGDPEGYLHIEASDTGTGWDDTYDIEFDTTLDASAEQWQFNFYTNQRGDDNDVTCQIQINENGGGWVDVGAEFGGSGDSDKVGTGVAQIWSSRSVDLSNSGANTDASTRVRILLTMPSDTGGLSWHNDYGIDTIEIVGTPTTQYEVSGNTLDEAGDDLGSCTVDIWLDNGDDTITHMARTTSHATTGAYSFTTLTDNTATHFVTAFKADTPAVMDVSERTITPLETWSGSVDLYLRSQVDKSETAGDGDLRLRGQSDKPPSGGISGNGTLAAQDATLTSEGISQSAGNGALSQDSTLSGSGDTQSLGNGTLVSGNSTLAGSGTAASLGSGVFLTDATLSGEGTSQSVGNGGLVSISTLLGEGTSQSLGNGALVSSDSQISGSGALAAGTRAGNGDLSANATVISGEGLSKSLGNGSLAANSNIAGSGVVLAPGATSGNGNLDSSVYQVSGEGISQSLGDGDLQTSAEISASGTSKSSGDGALQTSAALSGTGIVVFEGDGALVLGAAVISGSGVSQSIGSGSLIANDNTISGSDQTQADIEGSGNLSVSFCDASGHAYMDYAVGIDRLHQGVFQRREGL